MLPKIIFQLFQFQLVFIVELKKLYNLFFKDFDCWRDKFIDIHTVLETTKKLLVDSFFSLPYTTFFPHGFKGMVSREKYFLWWQGHQGVRKSALRQLLAFPLSFLFPYLTMGNANVNTFLILVAETQFVYNFHFSRHSGALTRW